MAESAATTAAMATVGALLQQTRAARNLTLAQVAEETKLSEAFLAALEADDFAALPGGSYPAIFLKTYARQLGLDAAVLLKHYYAQVRATDAAATAATAARQADAWWRDRRVIAGAAVAAVLVGVALLLPASPPAEETAPAAAPAADTAPAPAVTVTGDWPARAAAAATAAEKETLARELQQQAEQAADPLVAAEFYRLLAQVQPRFRPEATLARLAKRDYDAGAQRFVARDYAAALPLLRRATLINPADAYAHFLHGRALELTGDMAGAEQSYRAAIAGNRPAFARYHYYLAALLEKRGDRDGARAALQAFRAAGGDRRAPALDAEAAKLAARLAR